jgi:pseudouridine-5'-phosphate glycosidase
MNKHLDIRGEVAKTLASQGPVVALESSVLAHGLPHPHNLDAARRMETAIREEVAVPATTGVLDGRLVVGLSGEEIEQLAMGQGVAKVSRADLSSFLVTGRPGATTVAAAIFLAAQAGIRVLATGGIGGVHRGGEKSLDISADLGELARTPLAVVCSGAKGILDLARTLEMLETLGVPVVGYGTSEFPAFYAQHSGLFLDYRVDTPAEAARLMAAQWDLGLSAGIVFAHPPPAASALSRAELEALAERATASATRDGIRGKALTPYLLDRLARESGGRTLECNVALLAQNARVAARIAASYSALLRGSPRRSRPG